MDEIKEDIKALLTIVKPKLLVAHTRGDGKLYHETSEKFIPVAIRVFKHLHEKADIKWVTALMFRDNLYNQSFWMYTDFVQEFCNYLELINTEKLCLMLKS